MARCPHINTPVPVVNILLKRKKNILEQDRLNSRKMINMENRNAQELTWTILEICSESFWLKRSKFQIFHSKILAPATSTSPPTQHQGVRFYPRPPPQYLSKYNYLRPLAPAHQHHPGRRRRDQWNQVSRSRYHSWPINGGGGAPTSSQEMEEWNKKVRSSDEGTV